MSEIGLPESLERLEINPERADTKGEDRKSKCEVPACPLESISLKAICSKGNCHCSHKDKSVKRLLTKGPILRRSKLRPVVLRAPILRLPPSPLEPPLPSTSPGTTISTTTPKGPKILGASFQTNQKFTPENQDPPLQRPYTSDVPPQACCVQARLAPPSPSSSACPVDDTNIDELASYFDLFVHIPKKMSVMAEMMYI